MKSKKGVSLAILAIIIIVMIILSSTVIVVASNTVSNSKKAVLLANLEQIEDLAKKHYIETGALPIANNAVSYNKTTFTNLIIDGRSSLIDEIIENGDDNNTFYKIEINKLDVNAGDNTIEQLENYYIASNSFNVYYLRGEKIGKEYYFSISKKLTGKTKIPNNQTLDTSDITISNVTSIIKLKKSTEEYTNNLKVDINVVLEDGETITYKIANQVISVPDGSTTIDVANIILNNSQILSDFYQNNDNKFLVVQKKLNGEVLSEAKLNISNLDLLAGNAVTGENITYSRYDDFVLANISGYEDLGGSGVKEARVLYITKRQLDNTTVPYYDNLPATITKEYVKNIGQSFNSTILKLPSDVVSYALVFIDNAGNVSDVATYAITD